MDRTTALALWLHLVGRDISEIHLEHQWKYGKRDMGIYYRVTVRLRPLGAAQVEEVLTIAKQYGATVGFGLRTTAEPALELT